MVTEVATHQPVGHLASINWRLACLLVDDTKLCFIMLHVLPFLSDRTRSEGSGKLLCSPCIAFQGFTTEV